MRIVDKSIPDWSRPGLPTTASGVAQQGICGNYATASENKRRKKGGRQVKRQREVWKRKRSLIRMGTLNIGTMTGRGRELADLMERRNLDILCLQETKWKGSKARNIGGGCKLFHKVTYESGGKSTQVDYVVCRRKKLKEMCDCKVIVNECVAKQHRMVVCKMVLMVKKKKAEKVKPKMRWWN